MLSTASRSRGLTRVVPHLNYVGVLYEWSQRGSSGGTVTTIRDAYSSIGMPHVPSWSCTLTLSFSLSDDDERSFTATGSTKKEAKNLAARQACIALGLVDPPVMQQRDDE
ncbi:hypothetical protein JCM11491_000706 [Sporobolomyces phaffii]